MSTETLRSANEIRMESFHFTEHSTNITMLWNIINTIEDTSHALQYDQKENRYLKKEAKTNIITLATGVKYCQLIMGGFATLYETPEAQQQAKREFEALAQKFTNTKEIQCPGVYAMFEYPEKPSEGETKKYGLYLSAEKRTLGASDGTYMVDGVILAPGAYMKASSGEGSKAPALASNIAKSTSEALRH